MDGDYEERVTYPSLLKLRDGSIYMMYRHGGSGNGNEIFNRYDAQSRTWKRLLDRPLTDGRGKMNAYILGPHPGPDGYYHISWVWRDTPDCCTNHDLS